MWTLVFLLLLLPVAFWILKKVTMLLFKLLVIGGLVAGVYFFVLPQL